MNHLSPEELLDIAEGARQESSAPHLRSCEACREQLAQLRAVMTAIDVDVPEPSPLFWDHLSARVREAVVREEELSASRRWRFAVPWSLAAAMSAAVVLIAVSLAIRIAPHAGTVAPAIVTSTPANDAASANEPGASGARAEDASLSLLSDLAEDLDWDAAAAAGITMAAGAADGAIAEMTEVERAELQRLLREAMAGSGV